jgi:ABC-type multidrug transport system, ATPase and permease components
MRSIKKSLHTLLSGLEMRCKAYTLLCPVLVVIEVVLETLIPLLTADIIDTGIANGDLSFVLQKGLVMTVCAAAALFTGVLGAKLGASAAVGFSRNVRRNVFAAIQNFSFANTDTFGTASLVTRLTTDVTNAQNVYMMIVRICFRAPFMLILGTTAAFFINARLALIFLCAVPILALTIFVIARTAHPRFEAMLVKYDTMNRTVQESLRALRLVKSFVRGDFENEKFKKAADAVRKAQLSAESVVIFLMPIMQLVVYSSIIASLWFGGRMVVFGSMKAGELVSFLSYVWQILMALMIIGMVFIGIVLARASVKRILEILNTKTSLTECKDALTEIKDGSVEFENVSFRYAADSDNEVLSGINLRIKSGQTVGIIGGTGAAKTTLVQLIPRLYDVSSGTVKVGGVDVRTYALKNLRSGAALVLQKNTLFTGTIEENLCWGNKAASFDEVQDAAKIADAHSFITSLPDGYQTLLGQGGVNLSGGQKQRLCIARTLLKKPKILILDDSTSALDTATESKVKENLCTRFAEITKIIIAERISSVKDADCIIVLDGGKICGIGTHAELLENNAIYKEVAASQATGGLAGGDV